MSVTTILLITLLNAAICLALPRLLAIDWQSAIAQLWERQDAVTSTRPENLSLGENPSQS